MIVHDLRHPLANIVSSMSIGETALPDITDDSVRGEIAEVIDLSKTNANDLLDLVNSISKYR